MAHRLNLFRMALLAQATYRPICEVLNGVSFIYNHYETTNGCYGSSLLDFTSKTVSLVADVADELMVPHHKLLSAHYMGWRPFSVWNSLADNMRDPFRELNSVMHRSNTLLFVHHQSQRIESIRDIMTMRYINLLTY